MTRPRRVSWVVPFRVWVTLFSMVLGVFVLGGVFTLAMWRQQAENSRRDADLRRDLCAVLTVQTVPTPIPSGPAGDRTRAILPKVEALRKTTCDKGAHGEG